MFKHNRKLLPVLAWDASPVYLFAYGNNSVLVKRKINHLIRIFVCINSLQGRFEIISLSGSYVRTEVGGRTGGLSVCLSSADGQIIGGGVGGPLKASGPVQVIVGTFMIDNKKDGSVNAKGDVSGSKLPSPVAGTSVSNVGFRSAFEAPVRNPIGSNDDHQSFGGSHFMMQPQGLHLAAHHTDWRSSLDDRTAFELTGKTGHGAHQSPENGDYD
ncbi:hypothetical protein F3Y22_tig00111151pilonHSYRG00255 [Hibiscus syriacus]|uniref:AT-hook motif nuclear-localized protein n=1 Tax=Hibiscus syriacus TaxID=106335 RepID=A0A6A2YXK3_HIBSY|nr:hypothetical protein F3Y22_tig00111151pilonHSYRG00255 [Hibiscus syriacus]